MVWQTTVTRRMYSLSDYMVTVGVLYNLILPSPIQAPKPDFADTETGVGLAMFTSGCAREHYVRQHPTSVAQHVIASRTAYAASPIGQSNESTVCHRLRLLWSFSSLAPPFAIAIENMPHLDLFFFTCCNNLQAAYLCFV